MSRAKKEFVGGGEQVIAVLEKEGKEMKPEDMQCEAKTDEDRCEEKKSFNEESDTWLRWCRDHQEQEKLARIEGGPRVERFSE